MLLLDHDAVNAGPCFYSCWVRAMLSYCCLLGHNHNYDYQAPKPIDVLYTCMLLEIMHAGTCIGGLVVVNSQCRQINNEINKHWMHASQYSQMDACKP
jgi:hypothetical protein